MRRSVALEIPFRERQFGEDLDWGHRALLAGHKIVFEPRSRVVHSHNNSTWYEFKRAYLDQQNSHRLFGVQTIPCWRNVFWCSALAMGHLFLVVKRDRELGLSGKLAWWVRVIPYAFSQNLGQFLGARSVGKLDASIAGYARLDRLLRKGV